MRRVVRANDTVKSQVETKRTSKFSIEGNSSSSSIQNVARSERARNYLQRPLGCFGGCKPDSCGDLMYMHGAHRREETRIYHALKDFSAGPRDLRLFWAANRDQSLWWGPAGSTTARANAKELEEALLGTNGRVECGSLEELGECSSRMCRRHEFTMRKTTACRGCAPFLQLPASTWIGCVDVIDECDKYERLTTTVFLPSSTSTALLRITCNTRST